MTLTRFVILAVAFVIGAFSVACGGDEDGGAVVALLDGPVNCARMKEESYNFFTTVNFQVDAPPTPTPAGVAPAPNPLSQSHQIHGSVEDADSYRAVMSVVDPYGTTTTMAVRDGDHAWLKDDAGWREEDPGTGVIPYQAVVLCKAVAPDIDPGPVTKTSERVNGIDSARVDFTGLQMDWPDRSADFGSGSDVALLINMFSGSVWIANDGNYISKLELTGEGSYPDGSILRLEVSYEISDWGADISVEPPA